MNKGLYLRLALQNLKKNRRTYVPYMLTGGCTVSMYYVMNFLALNQGIGKLSGGENLKVILGMGVGVISIFAGIFLFYTNSFLIKRRKRELGLYNILGMEKKHIGKILLWETLMSAGISLFLGNLLGILGSKLMYLILMRLLQFPIALGFFVSWKAVWTGGALFVMIFLLSFLYNLKQIHSCNPVNLLREGSTGEREPRTKLILTLAGIMFLGIGYAIAVVTESPTSALPLFFLAVLLVMAGTYCLFTAVSITLLKFLRSRKNYYYQIKHFVGISGMLYRMKQNAVGLANICILSTGVLLMISSTLSLYMGMEDVLKTRFPYEVAIKSEVTGGGEERTIMEEAIGQIENQYELQAVGTREYHTIQILMLKEGSQLLKKSAQDYSGENGMPVEEVTFITLKDYNRLSKETRNLEEGEVFLYTNAKEGYNEATVSFAGQTMSVKEELKEFFISNHQNGTISGIYIIVKDLPGIEKILEKAAEQAPLTYVREFHWRGNQEVFAAAEQQLAEKLRSGLAEASFWEMEGREMSRGNFLIISGGLFFLGIFLGAMFLMGTAMIIYYKQISEGMDDRERFGIMQKVGMSRKEIRGTIRSQVLTVFFLPLLMAVVHISFSFPLITRLLSLMGLFNVGLFALCTAATIVIFALVYALIYAVTAKVYYHIVN